MHLTRNEGSRAHPGPATPYICLHLWILPSKIGGSRPAELINLYPIDAKHTQEGERTHFDDSKRHGERKSAGRASVQCRDVSQCAKLGLFLTFLRVNFVNPIVPVPMVRQILRSEGSAISSSPILVCLLGLRLLGRADQYPHRWLTPFDASDGS